MRKGLIALALAAALGACGGDARTADSAAQVDSGPAPTPALDSVGTGEREQGRGD